MILLCVADGGVLCLSCVIRVHMLLLLCITVYVDDVLLSDGWCLCHDCCCCWPMCMMMICCFSTMFGVPLLMLLCVAAALVDVICV